jgi:hypothetical protein
VTWVQARKPLAFVRNIQRLELLVEGSDSGDQRILVADSGGESLRATGAAASNFDLNQVKCTFHDATGLDDLRYLLSRAIQVSLPGVTTPVARLRTTSSGQLSAIWRARD